MTVIVPHIGLDLGLQAPSYTLIYYILIKPVREILPSLYYEWVTSEELTLPQKRSGLCSQPLGGDF